MNPGQNAAFIPTVASSGRDSGGSPSERLATLPSGVRVGRYEIIAVLGQGGFGINCRDHQAAFPRRSSTRPSFWAWKSTPGGMMPPVIGTISDDRTRYDR